MAVGRQADYLIESDPSGSARYMIEALRILRHVPLPDQSATVLWTIASVHHWADLDAALSEAKRVLRPQGRLVAIERHSRPGVGGHGSHGWTDDQATAFAAFCHQHGFINVEVARHRNGRRRTISVTASAPPPAA